MMMTSQLNPEVEKLLKPALSVRGLSKTYGTGEAAKTILSGVSFEAKDNETLSIVGPSGAGKTTLLRCLGGLLEPTGGEVFLREDKVVAPPDRLAVVFQDYSRSLMPWMTVQSNIELPLRSKELTKAERRERSAEALESVGLGSSGRLYPWQLSGGMQQRVAIARALAYQPAVLLMDEPFASVDAQTRATLEDLTLRIKARYKMTIVLVTHDIEESVYLGDRVIVMAGTPTTVAEIVEVPLPYPRDQITTKSTREFAELRAHVLGLIRQSERF
jgi:NitT/TauT family transport system ATP-binding protein